MNVRTPTSTPDPTSQRLVGAPNLNRLWADLIVEELVRCGVGLFCLASGSRSAPLATAVAAHPDAGHLVHFDERGCAFAALGWARATGRPACWITTSGTAVANGFPAVVEAAQDGVPLIALTADRPPELRQAGANQAIDQPGIFGAYVRWHFDIPTPSPDVTPSFVLSTVDQAVHRSLAPRGPVHLNVMYREPLAPEMQAEPLPPLPRRWLTSGTPYTVYDTPAGVLPEDVEQVARAIGSVERGVIVAGRLRSRQEAEAALRLAAHLGWPLLPDVCSQLRLGPDHPAACRLAELALSSDDFSRRHRAEAIILLGSRPASGRLDTFLASGNADPFVVVRDDPFRSDPHHVVTHRVQASVEHWCDALVASVHARTAGEWQARWRAASDAAGRALEQSLSEIGEVNEPGVARSVSRHVAAGHALVVASSMPVRDLDTFAVADGPAPALVAANRGASGIDGIVATAAGMARGLGAPATLLIGDLALLHDLNSLALLRAADQPPVVIVVVNNDGGGIFHFLPIADHEDFFEPLFGTPHGMPFQDAAAQFGLGFSRHESSADFEQAFADAVAGGESVIIEVGTDRVRNRELHERLSATAAQAVEESAAHIVS